MQFTIAFDNQDASVPHNVAIYPEGDGAKAVFTGDIITGVADMTYQVPACGAAMLTVSALPSRYGRYSHFDVVGAEPRRM